MTRLTDTLNLFVRVCCLTLNLWERHCLLLALHALNLESYTQQPPCKEILSIFVKTSNTGDNLEEVVTF